ncbi:hypothetical protein [Motilibacter aurantiacus]|uniref:hypothetical protein n=1 Tax=Motilibacter aurantiacus TaxID=2714955 RepID=UPI00140AD870|nr:hypothetical protein [Motilibacter aurantiacus]NHC47286.1 hypothetical protein [Motilibacter aurantiacus]
MRAVLPRTAALRVYEPLAGFPEPERSRWAAYADRSPAARAAASADGRHLRLAGLAATPPVVVPPRESDEAHVLVRSGVVHVCPEQPRLRAWEALADLRAEYPQRLVDAFVPPVVLEQAERDHARWRTGHPDVRPHVRTAGWQVPLAWLVLLADAERELSLGAARYLRYRTPMSAARRAAARALRTLRLTPDEVWATALRGDVGDGGGDEAPGPAGPDGPEGPGGPLALPPDADLLDEVEDVARWLEEFHPRSWVELDYCGLVDLLPRQTLEDDHSARDTAEVLARLASGDGAAAAAAYARLERRWEAVQALERAN